MAMTYSSGTRNPKLDKTLSDAHAALDALEACAGRLREFGDSTPLIDMIVRLRGELTKMFTQNTSHPSFPPDNCTRH